MIRERLVNALPAVEESQRQKKPSLALSLPPNAVDDPLAGLTFDEPLRFADDR